MTTEPMNPVPEGEGMERELTKLSEALRLCQCELAQVRAGQEVLEEKYSESRIQSIASEETSRQLASALAAQLAGLFWEQRQPTSPVSVRRFVASRWPWLRKLAHRLRSRREHVELQQVRLIEASELMQPVWYLQHNADVARAGLSPAVHYLRAGACEGRDPGPDFSTLDYLAAHPEVGESGINPLIHHLQSQLPMADRHERM